MAGKRSIGLKRNNKRVTKTVRNVVTGNEKGVKNAPKNFDSNAEWEIEEYGGLYLIWGKKRVRAESGAIRKVYYIKDKKQQRIWIKWTVGFHDGIRWSAERQDFLVNVKKEVEDIFIRKECWPMPGPEDGANSGWKERIAICQKLGYTEWKPKSKSEQKNKYQLIDPELPMTQSEIEDTDEDSEGEEDQV